MFRCLAAVSQEGEDVMVYQEVTSTLQNPLARERKEVIETDLESVVLILGRLCILA